MPLDPLEPREAREALDTVLGVPGAVTGMDTAERGRRPLSMEPADAILDSNLEMRDVVSLGLKLPDRFSDGFLPESGDGAAKVVEGADAADALDSSLGMSTGGACRSVSERRWSDGPDLADPLLALEAMLVPEGPEPRPPAVGWPASFPFAPSMVLSL